MVGFDLPLKVYTDGQGLGPSVIDVSAVFHLPVLSAVQLTSDLRIVLLEQLQDLLGLRFGCSADVNLVAAVLDICSDLSGSIFAQEGFQLQIYIEWGDTGTLCLPDLRLL